MKQKTPTQTNNTNKVDRNTGTWNMPQNKNLVSGLSSSILEASSSHVCQLRLLLLQPPLSLLQLLDLVLHFRRRRIEVLLPSRLLGGQLRQPNLPPGADFGVPPAANGVTPLL